MFKKRKRVTNRRDGLKEDWEGEEVKEEELASRPTKQVKKGGLVVSKQGASKMEQHRFESSQSAMPSGKTDQGAAVDTAQDREEARKQQKAANRAGPVFSATNVRISCRFDYQPDICKDWKETGYCGYGDSCKFLHDRGDYKSGWQIEREWEAEQKKKQDRALYGPASDESGEEDYFIGSDDEDVGGGLPFACLKCRGPFVSPVSTRCKHYFCESCALEHYKTDSRCFICKEPTGGQFNIAHDLLKKLKEKTASAKKNDSADSNEEGDDGEGQIEGHGEEREREQEQGQSEPEEKPVAPPAPRPKGQWTIVQ